MKVWRLGFLLWKSDRWNRLHQWIIDSDTVNSFKNGQKRGWATPRTDWPSPLAWLVLECLRNRCGCACKVTCNISQACHYGYTFRKFSSLAELLNDYDLFRSTLYNPQLCPVSTPFSAQTNWPQPPFPTWLWTLVIGTTIWISKQKLSHAV